MGDEKPTPADAKKSGGNLTKVIGVVFGAVIAPILVAVGVKYLSPKDHPPDPAAKTTPTDKGPVTTPPEAKKPLTSGNLITADLAENFYSFGRSAESKAVVRDDKVDPNWFRFVATSPGPNAQPSIYIPGTEEVGFLSTKNTFENYSLHVWWRWGEKTYGNRAEKARWASILLNIAEGSDGSSGVMPTAIVVHFREGQVGNIRLMGPEDAITCSATARRPEGQVRPVFDKSAPPLELASTGKPPIEITGKKMQWDGTIYRKNFNEAEYEDVKQDPKSLESGWRRVRIDCVGGAVRVYVAQQLVNEITNCNLTRGRIGITSQQCEWYVGKFEVAPTGK